MTQQTATLPSIQDRAWHHCPHGGVWYGPWRRDEPTKVEDDLARHLALMCHGTATQLPLW